MHGVALTKSYFCHVVRIFDAHAQQSGDGCIEDPRRQLFLSHSAAKDVGRFSDRR
jgi:hypothetical protein